MDTTARAAFEAFVRASGPSLVHTAWLLTGDRGHAEDVAQTALERVAARWGRLDGEPEAYARRAVVNLARDRWRRRRVRVTEVPLDTAGERAGPEDPVALLALRAELVAAVRALPTRQREVLVCRYFLDLDEASTAETLRISVGAVKSTNSRALARLRTTSLNPGPTPPKELVP